jgi:hypothetical protein
MIDGLLQDGRWASAAEDIIRDRWVVNQNLLKLEGIEEGSLKKEVLLGYKDGSGSLFCNFKGGREGNK